MTSKIHLIVHTYMFATAGVCMFLFSSESLGKIKKSPGGMSPLVGVATSSSGSSSSSSQKTEDSARRHIASELLHTEKNFVEILDTIVKVSQYTGLVSYSKL